MNKEQQQITTRYTLVPINDPTHQAKLQTYMAQTKQQKSSFCRFYLRGICIMKPHHCKFAHSFQQLILEEDDEQMIKNCNYNEKQRKKLYFQSKQDFQQKALFILKNVDYFVLYDYQHSQKWQKSLKFKKIHTLEELKQDRNLRIKIRQVLHRQNWSKLIDYLSKKYPAVDYPISFLSKWFSKVGFEKPQTRSKFGDFMRYMIAVKGFKEVNTLIPPRVQKTVFFVNCNQQAPKTYLYENIEQLQQLHFQAKEEYKKQMLVKSQPLPQELRKKFICRYFMAGNCEYTEQECNYAHSVQQLRHEVGQKFEPIHKQLVKGRQERLNYISLHRYCVEKVSQTITLEELNANSTLRSLHRREMHLWLYSSFMEKLVKDTGNDRFKLGFIEKEYNGAGFNHSDENKFGQFQSALWDIGYLVEEIKPQGSQGKSTYVYKVPPIQQLDVYYKFQVNSIIEEQVKAINSKISQMENKQQQHNKASLDLQTQEEVEIQINGKMARNQSSQLKEVILQSSFRKKIYRNQQPFIVPLHIYLKLKAKSLQQIIKQFVQDKNLLEHMFFQTNQQNYKKLIDLSKTYFKGKKDYVHKVESIEFQIKTIHKDQINLNHYVNLRNFLNSAIIQSGKRIYFLAFGNNCLVIDKGNLLLHQKTVIKGKYHLKSYETQIQDAIMEITQNKFSKERIVIVDSEEALNYAEIFLSKCNKYGVDLEGRLKKQGYIDLIQISAIFNNKKQIFVFDIFFVKKLPESSLYLRIQSFLKNIFQDPSRVKILHDCKQDSAALKYLMGISLLNVFDTSGMNIVLEQKEIYQKWNKKEESIHHILKKVFDIKVPGLNSVLQRWGAPNGVNIFKESMKKRFHKDGTRTYFEQRPIDPQFLQYSAQDVQDLIQVYEAMKKADTQKISEVIGEIYSTFHFNNNSE